MDPLGWENTLKKREQNGTLLTFHEILIG